MPVSLSVEAHRISTVCRYAHQSLDCRVMISSYPLETTTSMDNLHTYPDPLKAPKMEPPNNPLVSPM